MDKTKSPTNLYEFYTGQGKSLPSVADRQGSASEAGIKDYTGTAEQNTQLLSYLSKPKTVPTATGAVTPPVAPTTTPPTAPTTPATPPVTPTTDSTKTSTTDSTTKSQDQIDLDTANTNFQNESTKVRETILNIQNGTIPLSAGEQAQVDGLKQQFQTLINEQQLTNTGASGLANTRGYQTGSAEYDPSFQVKTIGSIIASGQNKIADLNTKMASAVAQLTQSFKDNNISAVKSAWDIYNNAYKERATTLQKTIENTQKVIKEAQDAKQKITDKITEIAIDAKKNGADKATIDAITSSGTINGAIANSGDYLQSATGDLGNYLQYKRETMQKGLTPMEFTTYQDQQEAKKNQADINKAYATAKASAQGKAAGTPPGTTTDENGNVIITSGNFSPLDIGRYNLAASRATKTFKDTQVFKAATNAGFYVAKIKAANEGTGSIQDQEILDAISQFNTGGGRVTEAQVNIILKGKSLNDKINSWGNKLKNGGVLSDKQRKQALELANATAEQFASNYENKYNSLAPKLEKQGIPKEFWGIPSPAELKGEADTGVADVAGQVDAYVKANPAQAQTISKLYSVPGATDQDVLDYINLTNNK